MGSVDVDLNTPVVLGMGSLATLAIESFLLDSLGLIY